MLPSARSWPSAPTCQTMIWLLLAASSSAATTYTVAPPSDAIEGTGESTMLPSVLLSGCVGEPNAVIPVCGAVGHVVLPLAGFGIVQIREYQLALIGSAFVPSTMWV